MRLPLPLFALLPLTLAACVSSSAGSPGGAGGDGATDGGSPSSSAPGCPAAPSYLLPLTKLSPNGGTIPTIVSDGSTLYLGAQTGLFSMPVAGGPLTAIYGMLGADTATSGVGSFWFSGANVLFIDAESYVSVPKTGGSPTTLAMLPNAYGDAVTDGTTVYFISNQFGHSADGGVLMVYSLSSIPIGGGTPTPILDFDSEPTNLILSGGSLYWIEAGEGIFASGPIYALPVTGSKATNTGITAWDSQLAADDTYLYYSSEATGYVAGPVMRIAKSGLSGTPTQVSNLGGDFLAVQGTNVFGAGIVGQGGVEAWVAPASGGTAKVLACAPTGTTLHGLGVDASKAYVAVTESSSESSGILAVSYK